jgi:sugar lactone lactonase YvrE
LRWRDGALWCSDMAQQAVLRIAPDGTTARVVDTPGPPSGLGWLPDGRLLVVSMHDRRVLRLDPEGLVEHANLNSVATYHANDMLVDPQGRAYVGNFGFDFMAFVAGRSPEETFADTSFIPADLALVEPDGTVRVAAKDLRFPNGTVLTPDGRTLIVAETHGPYLTAFSVAADGSLHDRREWAPVSVGPPDGICLDAEGAIWVTTPLANVCARIAERGEVLERVATSLPSYSCALGGPDGKTLYIATAPPPGAPSATPAGRIEVATVAVRGV